MNGPWHQRIPNNATSNYAPNSGGVVGQLLNSGAWNSNYIHDPEPNINQGYDNGGGYPNYVCQVGDGSCVRMTLSCTTGPGYCSNSRGTVNGLSFYFPKYGIPEANGLGSVDNHMSVLDCVSVAPSCREINLYNYGATMNPPSGGYRSGYTMGVGAGDYTNPINGDGWGSTSVGGEVTVSGATLFAGLVRSAEIASGIGGIQHAIPLDINCGNTSSRVYPATGTFGHACSDQSNAAPAGSRFYWDESCATISGRPIDAWSKALLCALHNYGGYAVDTNGFTSITFAEDAEMPFGGITGYRDYVTPFAKTYGSYLGFSQYGGAVYGANLNNEANGLSASVISAHLHLLRSCVNGPAGSQGSC